MLNSFAKKVQWVFNRITTSPTLILGVLAVLVGLSGGAGVWLFKRLIDLLHNGLWSLSDSIGAWSVALIPVLGGLVVGLVAHFLIGDEKLHGTASIMQSVALAGGRLRYQRTPVKTLAAILSIGSGASVGPEDPSVQIGASLGSMFGQVFHQPEERVRLLVAAGAAAAIAAAFNAPIAGVFFALEIILGEIGGSGLGMILVAAVASAVLTQAVSGTQPAFQIPAYAFRSAWELPLYLLLGLLAGVISALYVRLLYQMQDWFGGWNAPRWIKPAVAGALVGLTGLFLPQIFGVGYETIGGILNRGSFSILLLLALLAAKLILTPVCIGGGFYGGVFAPSLFVGVTLGGAFGAGSAALFPGLGINPAAFALVGMAAVLAGAVHAPLTASILLFEMTGDYRIMLPLLFSVAVSLLVSQRIQRDSVYALGLARHGIRLERRREVDVLATLTVGEVMRLGEETLNENQPLREAADLMTRTRHHGLAVLNDRQELVGILALGDIDRAIEAGRMDETVSAVCSRDLVTTTPDEVLALALQRMSRRDLGRLPVVTAENPTRLVGMLHRADVIHAYQLALERQTTRRTREHALRLDSFTPVRLSVADVVVAAGSGVDGLTLREITLPHDCVIASVQRGTQVLVPRGDTRLQAGDVLVVVAEPAVYEQVAQLCR